jgi:hypothetical protein
MPFSITGTGIDDACPDHERLNTMPSITLAPPVGVEERGHDEINQNQAD